VRNYHLSLDLCAGLLRRHLPARLCLDIRRVRQILPSRGHLHEALICARHELARQSSSYGELLPVPKAARVAELKPVRLAVFIGVFIAELLGPPELVAPPLRAEMIQVSLASRLRQQTRIACLRCRPRGLRSNAIYPCVSKASSARVAKAFNIQQLHHQPVNPLRSVRREEEVAVRQPIWKAGRPSRRRRQECEADRQ